MCGNLMLRKEVGVLTQFLVHQETKRDCDSGIWKLQKLVPDLVVHQVGHHCNFYNMVRKPNPQAARVSPTIPGKENRTKYQAKKLKRL